MKLRATNEVRAKSKFWYFLRKLKKVKKSNGQVLAINEELKFKTARIARNDGGGSVVELSRSPEPPPPNRSSVFASSSKSKLVLLLHKKPSFSPCPWASEPLQGGNSKYTVEPCFNTQRGLWLGGKRWHKEIGMGSIVKTIKAKVMRSLKRKVKNKKNKEGSSSSSYAKMDKTASIKVEIQSRQARQLINKTLMAADRPSKAYIP